MEHPELQQQNLLVDFEDTYVRASHGRRIGNYLLDILAFYVFIFIVAFLLALINIETFAFMEDINPFLDQLISLMLYTAFMFAQEAIFKGRSVGKFLTGTRAVNLDGSTITQRTAMLRALSRAVPFCAFSALGTPCDPWQDKWTDTMVIDHKRSTALDPANN